MISSRPEHARGTKRALSVTFRLAPLKVRFARDSPLEGGGFELPVPDERGYGLAFVCRVMGLLFGAQLLGFEGAKRPDSLAGRPGSRAFFGGRLTKRQANPRRRQVRKASMEPGRIRFWRVAACSAA